MWYYKYVGIVRAKKSLVFIQLEYVFVSIEFAVLWYAWSSVVKVKMQTTAKMLKMFEVYNEQEFL